MIFLFIFIIKKCSTGTPSQESTHTTGLNILSIQIAAATFLCFLNDRK